VARVDINGGAVTADLDEVKRHPRALARSTIALLAMICLGSAVWVWDGRRARDLTFEQLVNVVGNDPCPDAAIERLRARVQEAIRTIRLRADDADRTGKLARNAIEHILKEASK
jgi:type VI protein secretion system component VasK